MISAYEIFSPPSEIQNLKDWLVFAYEYAYISMNISASTHKSIIYIYIFIFGPVKPELGVIPSGQEGIQAWIFKIFLVKSSIFLEISKMRNRIEINL